MTDAATGPLAGLVVADFSRVLAGPYATMLLADLGATVIKVEGPDGDETRAWRPPVHEGEATYYLSVNRNKRTITLDLTQDADRAVAHRLAARADVLIENFRPGGLERFELDYAAVAKRNPAVIYVSITGFGSGSALPGYDILAQALSGIMSVTGQAAGPATRAGVPIADLVTGMHAATGALAALHHRDRTGEGQRVEVNLLSSAMSTLAFHGAGYLLAGVVPGRVGNDHPSIFPYGAFPTADGDLVVAVGTDRQFGALCHTLGRPDLVDDERFAAAGGRSIHRDLLRPELTAALATRSAADWYDALVAAGVPCAPILDVAGSFAWAEQLGLDPVAVAGGMPGVRHPISLSRTPPAYPLAPPAPNADEAWVRAFLAEEAEASD